MRFIDTSMQYAIKVLTGCVGLIFLVFLGYMGEESWPLFQHSGIVEFMTTAVWRPLDGVPLLGIRNMVLSSLYVSVLAILIALPIGLGCAVYSAFCLREAGRVYWLAATEMIAGIPSVIFGFIGLVVLVKALENGLQLSSGECVLAGAIVLGVMILPFIISNCTESLLRGQDLYAEVAANLGVSKWYSIQHIILPQTLRAWWVSIILAFSRAVGETMAVMMVMGNTKTLPTLLGKGETIPALIALEMGSAEYGSLHYHGLYAAGVVLLLILVGCNLLFYSLRRYTDKGGKIR